MSNEKINFFNLMRSLNNKESCLKECSKIIPCLFEINLKDVRKTDGIYFYNGVNNIRVRIYIKKNFKYTTNYLGNNGIIATFCPDYGMTNCYIPDIYPDLIRLTIQFIKE